MPWTNSDIRRLLRYLDKPCLDDEPLAKELQYALRLESTRAAMLAIVERSFDPNDPFSALCRETVVSRDLRRIKTRQVAGDMHLSNRQYFRYRAAAIELIARTIDQILNHDAAASNSSAKFAAQVARFDPDAALKLYAAEPQPRGKLAFEILTTVLRAGKSVTQEMVDSCTGPWRLLAQAAIGRRFITNGEPESSEPWRRKVKLSLARSSGHRYDQAAFELAYMDRLEAVRRCDMNAAREAVLRMRQYAGGSESLLGLALVAQAEQACDDGDLERAERTLAQIERMTSAEPDFKVMARKTHAQAVVSFMRERYDEALRLAEAAAAALVQVEPGFALCAQANAGRAALQLRQHWHPPAELLLQYPAVWISGQIHAVHARHLLRADPEAASRAVELAVDIATTQNAHGALLYARATRGMFTYSLHRDAEAIHDWIEAWEGSLGLGRASYLSDLFAHPALGADLGIATLCDPLFVTVALRRLGKLRVAWDLEQREFGAVMSDPWLADALRFAIHSSLRRVRRRASGPIDAASVARSAADPATAVSAASQQIALEAALLLPPQYRPAFCVDFVSALRRSMASGEPRSIHAS